MTLGFDNLADYVARSPYFGCITGRYANRIAAGRFTLDGTTYQLPINNDPNSLHGGTVGFDKHVWAATPVRGRTSVGLRLDVHQPRRRPGLPGHAADHRHLHAHDRQRHPDGLPGDDRRGRPSST